MTWSTDEGWTRAPGGLVRAVAPVLASRGGATAWLGLLSSGAPTPPTRLVDTELFIERIGPRLERNALEGFANRTLWPALYGLTGLVEHLDDWWTGHLRLSEAVAQRLASALAVGGTVWLHDDHLIGAVGGLRRRRDDVRIVWTAHTPIDRIGLGSLVHTRHLLGALSGAADSVSVRTERDAEELQRLLRSVDIERPGPPIAARPVGFDPSWWERARTTRPSHAAWVEPAHGAAANLFIRRTPRGADERPHPRPVQRSRDRRTWALHRRTGRAAPGRRNVSSGGRRTICSSG